MIKGMPGIYEKGAYNSADIAYTRWYAMLRRCYDPKTMKAQPTYDGCYVCDEWLNFQNYAAWFHNTCPGNPVDYDVDKDLLDPYNKCYSPETCVFLPHALNILCKNDSGHNKFGCVGVVWDSERNKYRVRFEFKGVKVSGGRHETKEAALAKYLELKKEKIKEIAEEYKDVLEPRAYKALLCYEPKA